MNIQLNSENISADDLFSFEAFLDDIELSILLVLNKMSIDELNRRIDIIDKRNKL